MSEEEHVSKEEYRGIAREMAKDLDRTRRQREVERCHAQDLPGLLETLYRKHDGNASAVLRELNNRMDKQSVSRPTLYNWLDEFGVRD